MGKLLVDGDLNVVERYRFDAFQGVHPSLSGDEAGGVPAWRSGHPGVEVDLVDNERCLQSLRRHRWADGVTCPYCDSKDTIKDGTTGKDAQRYRCHNCDSGFNDLTGTIFAARGMSLPEMFYIIHEMDGTETAQIARQLDRSYNSVLDFVHVVKDARVEDTGIDLSDGSDVDGIYWTAGEPDIE